jgi:hypothetical protein
MAHTVPPERRATMLEVLRNLSHYHREHEKYHGEAPSRDAGDVLRASPTLTALAERWRTAEPAAEPWPCPSPGAPDLTDDRAIESAGVLFLQSGEPPFETGRIVGAPEGTAAGSESGGTWPAEAMAPAWEMAAALPRFGELADLLAERHSSCATGRARRCSCSSRLRRRATAVLGSSRLHRRGRPRRPGRRASLPRPALRRRRAHRPGRGPVPRELDAGPGRRAPPADLQRPPGLRRRGRAAGGDGDPA